MSTVTSTLMRCLAVAFVAAFLARSVVAAEVTPLHEAAQRGQADEVKALLAAGADVRAEDDDGLAPLEYAIYSGSVEVFDRLVAAGAEPVRRFGSGQSTPLHVAALVGSVPIVERLVAAGAELDHYDITESTPLLVAARHRNGDVARLLIAAGANTSVRDENSNSPFHLAIIFELHETVDVLMKAGADPNDQRPKDGRSALHMAAARGNTELLARLLAAGADVKHVDNAGWNALHFAAMRGRVEATKVLLAAAADPAVRGSDGNLPVDVARKQEFPDVVSLLEAAM